MKFYMCVGRRTLPRVGEEQHNLCSLGDMRDSQSNRSRHRSTAGDGSGADYDSGHRRLTSNSATPILQASLQPAAQNSVVAKLVARAVLVVERQYGLHLTNDPSLMA